jgi:hypothetical protein
MVLLQHLPFYLSLGAFVLALSLGLGWFASRGDDTETAWPRTNVRRGALTAVEIVVGVLLSPFLVIATVLFAIPMLLLSPLFLTDEYEEEEHHGGAIATTPTTAAA